MLKIANLIIAVVLLGQPICAQNSTASLGWDLTYSSVLERNNIGSGEWIRQWLASGYQAPAGKWISEWRGEPIVSSILLEFPAFHAGEHTTLWFVRTKNHAYYWQSVEGAEAHDEKEVLKPRAYDRLFTLASSWQQAKPPRVEVTPAGSVPGYIGFLSLYERGKSRQMLLSPEDFAICDTKECKTWKPGRLAYALKPVLLK